MEYNVVIPNNILSFKCAMCGECCTGWKIEIDKITCNKIKKELKKSEIEDKIKFEYSKGKLTSGTIKMLDDGKCSFLDSDNLCGLQKEKGINFISDVCKQYPRIFISTTRGVEQSMYFSCREALKLLDNDKPIEFDVNPICYNYEALDNSNAVNKVMENKMLKYYYLIEEMMIDIMQQRNQSLKDRLLLMGSLILSLYNAEDDEHLQIISEYGSIIGKNIDCFKEINSSKLNLIELINKLGESQLSLKSVSFLTKLFFEKFNNNMDKIEIDSFRNNNFKYEYILENLFVMRIFRKDFAYSDKLLKNYYWMVIQYIYILLSMNINDDFSKDRLLVSIYLSEKTFSHTSVLKNDLLAGKSADAIMLEAMEVVNYYNI
ncbi:flagellin lysine-N-methylase [Oceanirhabdus sp. W0125-5]|uniref:flagellin lysine-N-methylase n=1 Tax=Oceanirhabdus sp. W0125-5 TaxID=2999116 RepID=UPI0022F34056|nr:flagellin lysine-N-methylase [Oceanirhabdus sp. W0125-5]WBW95460.1 flagellin lysine-N-methylase [Oceanirhabdus sp. W0125-5]